MFIIFKQALIYLKILILLWLYVLLTGSYVYSQDSSVLNSDTGLVKRALPDAASDSSRTTKNPVSIIQNDFLLSNHFIGNLKSPIPYQSRIRIVQHREQVFYFLLFLLLGLGITKNYFHRYFSNMFRVFFNTSLRQNQLTDQLLQSRIPSFLFNLLYFFSAGFFIFILLRTGGVIPGKGLAPLFWIIIILSLLYFIKYCWLLFLGWLSGNRKAFSGYTFIIFLSTKIMGVSLLLLLPIITLAEPWLSEPVTWLTLALLSFLLLIRYFKAFNVFSDKSSISGFHFLIFLLGLELLPLALLWHALEKYIFKIS